MMKNLRREDPHEAKRTAQKLRMNDEIMRTIRSLRRCEELINEVREDMSIVSLAAAGPKVKAMISERLDALLKQQVTYQTRLRELG